jgi:beta-lactamase regulating signal transducer with metallopeptidase domain
MTSLPLIDLHTIALLVSERVVACLIAGTILTAGAGLALRLMNGQSARAKFIFCFATLSAIAAIPLVGWVHAQQVASSSSAAPMLRLPEEWATYICAVWAVGALIALSRVAFGLYRVGQVRQSCVPVTSTAIDPALQLTMDRFQSTRRAELCTSELVRVPTAIGFWRPAIALPTWCTRDLSPSELHSIVLHELEHLRRYDDWTNLFQRIVGAVFFFHPAVWWLESRLSLEREMACDDAVLAVVPDPKSYARCLVSLAEKSYLRRGIALAQAAVSRVQQLTVRVTQILNARRPGSNSVWKPALSIVAVTIFAGGTSLELAPRLVSFQGDEAQSRAVAAANLAPAISPEHSLASHSAFDLLPRPGRWITPTPTHPPARTVGDHKLAPNAVARNMAAANSLPRFAAEQPLTIAPERTAVTANNSPELTAFNAEWTLPDRATNTAPATPPAAQMLVMVVHTQQRDEVGNIFWSVRVVRWMVFHPQPQHRIVDPQVPAKT